MAWSWRVLAGLGGGLDGLGRDVIVPGGDHLALRVVEVLRRVSDDERLRVGVLERVPDDVEPVALPELGGLVPLVGGQPDRVSLGPALDLDPPDALDRVPVAGLRVGRAQAADVEADLEMPDPLDLPPSGRLEGDDQVFGGELGPTA